MLNKLLGKRSKDKAKDTEYEDDGDDHIGRVQDTSPEALRRLRDLIRARYQLDTYIWSNRTNYRALRPYIEKEMDKADAILTEIISIVSSWEPSNEHDRPAWSTSEWKMAQTIKERLLRDGKRFWRGNPPWNDDHDDHDDDEDDEDLDDA